MSVKEVNRASPIGYIAIGEASSVDTQWIPLPVIVINTECAQIALR